jgi:hypothetical protein
METFQTSFIPKKPIISAPLIESAPPTRMGLFMFLSILLLISMILASGGFYLYKASLLNKITSLQESIALARESFQADSVAELQLFDKRMNASQQILSGHTVLSPIFSTISSLTIPSIQFTKFSLGSSVDGKSLIVNMSGLAQDYKSIALEAQVFGTPAGKYFKDVVFSNLVLQTGKVNKGYVSFDISFTVDPALTSFDKNILINNGNTR